MSQTSFLESVVTWNQDQCKENLWDTLPRLTSQLAETTVSEEELGICKIICELFLPWVTFKDVERTVFIHITAKTCSIMDKLLVGIDELCRQTSLQTDINTSLEMIVEVLDCYIACFKYVQEEGGNSTSICDVHSLPYGAVHLLKGAYSHCKESGNIYGEFLPAVTDLLSALFKKAHGLQMALLGMLEKVTVDIQVTEEEVQDLCFICQGLFEVCQTVTSLDAKLVCSLWKTISRFSGRHSNHLKNDLDVDRMLVFLCDEIKSGFLYLFQLAPPRVDSNEMSLSQGDNAAFQKSLKVLSYQMRIIISLLDSFVDYVSQCEVNIFQMILCIYRNLPPSPETPVVCEGHIGEIQRHILNGTEPLISLLIGKQIFMECVTSIEKELVSPADRLPYLLMLIKILDFIPKQTESVIDKWVSPKLYEGDAQRSGLLDCVFKAVDNCYVEMSLTHPKQVTCTTNLNRSLSLYEFVCTHVCGFVGSLRARHFSLLEYCLLTNLLSQSVYVSTIVMDVWCFMARYGSADLCFKQTQTILELCSRPEIKCVDTYRPIQSLARRLFKFLAPDHQAKLVQIYPLEHNLWLYSIVPVAVLDESKIKSITDQLIAMLVSSLQEFVTSTELLHGNTEALISLLQSFNNCVCGLEGSLSSGTMESLGECIGQVWSVWQKDWINLSILRTCFKELLNVTGHCLLYLPDDVYFKIFESLVDAITHPSCSPCLKLAVINFLSKCQKFRFPPNEEQPKILMKIPQLFQKVLNDKDVLIHHGALDAFTHFAESTPYEEVVPQCLENSQYLQDTVVNFLNKKPCVKNNLVQEEYLTKQRDFIRSYTPADTNDKLTNNTVQVTPSRLEPGSDSSKNTIKEGVHSDMLDSITCGEEPSLKRKRLLEDQVYSSHKLLQPFQQQDKWTGTDEIIASLEEKVCDLEMISRSSLTLQNVDKLRLLHTRLKDFLNS